MSKIITILLVTVPGLLWSSEMPEIQEFEKDIFEFLITDHLDGQDDPLETARELIYNIEWAHYADSEDPQSYIGIVTDLVNQSWSALVGKELKAFDVRLNKLIESLAILAEESEGISANTFQTNLYYLDEALQQAKENLQYKQVTMVTGTLGLITGVTLLIFKKPELSHKITIGGYKLLGKSIPKVSYAFRNPPSRFYPDLKQLTAIYGVVVGSGTYTRVLQKAGEVLDVDSPSERINDAVDDAIFGE